MASLLTSPNSLPDTGGTPVVFWDFDGVFNFDASRNQINKYRDKLNLPGHLKRADVVTVLGPGYPKMWLTLNWSDETIRTLTSLKDTVPYYWVWLTSWVEDTHTLDTTLNVTSDATLLWDPNPPAGADLVDYRNNAKHDALLMFHKTHPTTPFAWVDDTATTLWDPANLTHPTPHLVLTPDSKYGVTRTHLDQLTSFLKSFSPNQRN